MDLSMNLYKVPEPGQTLLDDGGIAYTPGGKGANSAVAFAKLGANCVFCTKLGADAHGQKLFNYYKDCGINTSCIKVDPEQPTGLAVVMKAYGRGALIIRRIRLTVTNGTPVTARSFISSTGVSMSPTMRTKNA